MSCSSLPWLKKENASQPWTVFARLSAILDTIVQLSVVEILGVPNPTSSSGGSRRTGALTFCPLAAVVISIFSFGKLNNSVEKKFETFYKGHKQFFIHSKIVATRTMV